ncbi:hypothetical protein GMLC_34440 [Geomonas limicola]|uniref:DUF72 domain-containing protein n=1 Tax=Geomonas limicola TaxID=2740186 RepID=A0A6V8NB74_9BACT|nr:DUF72 domain-containing protein [Geomonas limicola]GFO69865.1 hypothetical protein GMLC_34440 [Geomonas limicola]
MEHREGIRLGTCSWVEKSLIDSGVFYPPEATTAEARLRYYAARFDTVEVESTFYALPTEAMVHAWCNRTPPGFLFHLKAHGILTGHPVDPRLLPVELEALLPPADRNAETVRVTDPALVKNFAEKLKEVVAPLRRLHRLGFIVLQFPPWFGFQKRNLAYLAHCKELLSGLPIAVEFRHGSWLTRHHVDYLFAFLKEHGITYITCDEPQFGTLATAPFVPAATTAIAYLRLHGRNAENWLDHATPRYAYRYSQDELASFANVAAHLRQSCRLVFVMFNNCHQGHSLVNAGSLQQILAGNPHTASDNAGSLLHKTSC